MKRRLMAVAAGATLIPLARCTERSTTLDPPTIYYGQDVCDICSMIISEERFSSAITLQRSGRIEHMLFDDVGEMLAAPAPEADDQRWWARDAGSGAWIDARTATFLLSDALMTPMGTGVAAYGSSAAAEAARSERPGDILTFEEIRGRLGAGAG